ncbi:GNAT family N-acetyltransferase [Salirhabdus sp. Marseille-P4669]|uniref:GNAT family N-acetyltransferase n=1 Tax=Salirhabdus sp. Marseille-P4669 TaxID=2042310 RepID=UPI000C7A0579|nr:GNAT family N-acetyltransferase [Salirhabdus sp. Marseille-P4669]
MGITLKTLHNNLVDLDAIATVFVECFPTNDKQEFRKSLTKHMTYEGFQGIVAYENSEVVGFAYGYTSLKGQYYRNLLESALTEQQQEDWLQDCFEFVELCVKTTARKKGIGTNLHDALFQNVTTQTAILTTQIDNLAARAMYKKLGWEEIKKPFYPGEEPYVILGKKL